MEIVLRRLAMAICCLAAVLTTSALSAQDPTSVDPHEDGEFRTSNEYIARFPGEAFTNSQKTSGLSVRYTAPSRDRNGNAIRRAMPTDADLAKLGELSNLESLGVNGGLITEDGIRQLSKCKKLVNYEHYGMGRADQLVPALRKACPNLARLDLSSSDLTDKGAGAISEFPKLERLILQNTRITSAFFQGQTFSEKLTHLDLSNTSVDSTVIALIPPNVTHLRLVATKIDENAIPDLLLRKNLEELELPGRRFSHSNLDRLREALPRTKINKSGGFAEVY